MFAPAGRTSVLRNAVPAVLAVLALSVAGALAQASALPFAAGGDRASDGDRPHGYGHVYDDDERAGAGRALNLRVGYHVGGIATVGR